MAPSRRRGAGKASSAAAAAAAKKQWKIGDLVLAKVKGFPAWPATVSEPEKWGFSADWKKVLVYFFGTKQIAFCNPADVEAFTEEKKKSLLSKRQGKGADFVRALEEIVDCFEKSKKQDGGDEFNSGDEGTVSNAGNNEGCVEKSWKKVQAETPTVVPNPRFGILSASADRNESQDPVGVPTDATEIADLNEMETVSEEPIENASFLDHVKETELATSNTSRKRSREKSFQDGAFHSRAPSVRKSRSISKVDSSKFQSHIMPVNDDCKGNDLVPNVMQDDSIRRNRRLRKSPDSSVWHDIVSPVCSAAFVSNGSSEDNASEIVATNSDAISLNEGSTLESTCKTDHPDTVVDYLERGAQVSDKHHLRAEAVVLKKKRRPNRKRVTHCAGTHTDSPSKESCLESGVNKGISNSPNGSEKVCERYCKADGDEHLPLVKRARVRMSKPLMEEKEHNNLVDTGEKSLKEVSLSHPELVAVSSSCPSNVISSRTSPEVKRAANGSSAPNGYTLYAEKDPLFWKTKQYQLRGCSVAGEAALPPSKRLHRALEAMSANAAEDGQDSEAQDTTAAIASNCCSNSDAKSSPHFTADSKTGNSLEVQDVKYSGDNDTCVSGRSRLSPSLTSPSADVLVRTSLEVKPYDNIAVSCPSPEKDCKEMLVEARDFVCVEDLGDSTFNTESGGTEIQIRSSLPSSGDCQEMSVGAQKLVCAEDLGDSSFNTPDSEDKSNVKSSQPSSNSDENQAILVTAPAEPMKDNHNDLSRPSNESSDDILRSGDAYSHSDGEHGTRSLKAESSDDDSEVKSNVKSSQPSSNSDENQAILVTAPAEPMKDNHNDLSRPSNESSDDILRSGDAYSHPDGEHGTQSLKAESSDDDSEVKTVGNVSPPKDNNLHLSVAISGSCENSESLMCPSDENTKVEHMCEVVNEIQHNIVQEDIDTPSYVTSMKGLIAAAQAKRHLSRSTSLSDNALDDKIVSDTVPSPSIPHKIHFSEQVTPHNSSNCHQSTLDNSLPQNDITSPDALPECRKSTNVLQMDKEGDLESMLHHGQKSSSKCMSGEANAARKSFETVLGTLSRTKDSIGRATRHAIDCAKYGIAAEVMEILARSLETESSLHRRVDLFFLVDSITQCSRGQKGEIGDIYPSAVQAALPRLLSAAAPPGNVARENRKQCLKVLKLWLERKTLPESIIRHHMQELDSAADASFPSVSSRRPSRTERALHDPIREMEGMHVDEYGSNANFQVPGFFMPRMLADEQGSDTDDKSFEAVTPEQEREIPEEREATPTSAIEKHHHILEDVDGELEMEDVAPPCIVDINASYNVSSIDSVPSSHFQFEQQFPLPFAPPLPEDKPPSPPPLPNSPPPIASLHSGPLPPLTMSHSFADSADSNHYINRRGTQNCLQNPISQQPCAPSTTVLESANYYAPGYRDFAAQMQRPSSSDPSCSFSGPHPSLQTGNSVQKMDGAPLHNKNYHLHPPPPILSNQFSYVQADQRAQSWMESSSSSSFTKRFPFGHDRHRDKVYDNRDAMLMAQHEIEERCRLPAPVHSGPVHSDNQDASYAPVSYYGPHPETDRTMEREWSFPPRALNYRHSASLRPPEGSISGANRATNFWRPR